MGYPRVSKEVEVGDPHSSVRSRPYSGAAQDAEADAGLADDLELVHGSDNIFRDFGDADADVHMARAILAAEIIKALDRKKLTVRAAEERTGIAASEFSRIRNTKLQRFTLDRLISILQKLDGEVEVRVGIRRRTAA